MIIRFHDQILQKIDFPTKSQLIGNIKNSNEGIVLGRYIIKMGDRRPADRHTHSLN